MEQTKGKYNEPFKPEDTPNPPQNMHPGVPENEQMPTKNRDQKQKPEQKKGDGPKEKLLGESETEIDDETTI
jgi:hypothetical protein